MAQDVAHNTKHGLEHFVADYPVAVPTWRRTSHIGHGLEHFVGLSCAHMAQNVAHDTGWSTSYDEHKQGRVPRSPPQT